MTAGQQQSALPALKRVCTDWAFTKVFVQFLFHAPKLFLQVLANGMVVAFDEQLHLPCTPGHLAFILTLDSLLSALSVYLNDVQA